VTASRYYWESVSFFIAVKMKRLAFGKKNRKGQAKIKLFFSAGVAARHHQGQPIARHARADGSVAREARSL
jgi:hypothetical protein